MPDLSTQMEMDEEVISLLENREIAVEFYSALCNMDWALITEATEEETIIDRLKGIMPDTCSYSWRTAGGIVADIRHKHYNTNENYMDFYCSGNEGIVSGTVRECFARMGWKPIG